MNQWTSNSTSGPWSDPTSSRKIHQTSRCLYKGLDELSGEHQGRGRFFFFLSYSCDFHTICLLNSGKFECYTHHQASRGGLSLNFKTARCITQHFQMSMQIYTNFWSKYMSSNIQWVGQQDAVCSGSKIPCELWCGHLATHSRVQSPVNAQWMPSRCRAKIPGRTKIIDRMGHVGTLVFPPKKTKKQPGVRIRLSSSKFLQTASVTTCCTAGWHPGECSDDSIAREEVRSSENERLRFSLVFGIQICICFLPFFCCKFFLRRFSWCDEFWCHPCQWHQPVTKHWFLSAWTARPWYVHQEIQRPLQTYTNMNV